MNQANITAEGCPVTEAELEAIARYSRRKLTAEEVYTFPLVLCDNDLDRDHECFTDAALEMLAVLFRGKTGIFDHDPRGEKQTARIYRCAVEEEPGRLNHRGEPYKALKAWAYMVRTAANADLILEIDGGIKKEVSVGCSIGKKVCSICGADRRGWRSRPSWPGPGFCVSPPSSPGSSRDETKKLSYGAFHETVRR